MDSKLIRFQILIWTNFDELEQQIHMIYGENTTIQLKIANSLSLYFQPIAINCIWISEYWQ